MKKNGTIENTVKYFDYIHKDISASLETHELPQTSFALCGKLCVCFLNGRNRISSVNICVYCRRIFSRLFI